MKKALFGIVGWNIAETTRMIEVAKILSQQYECHFFSHGGKFESLVLEAGYKLHRLEPFEDDAKIQLLWKIDRGESLKQPWTVNEVEQRIQNEIDLIHCLQPEIAFLGSVLTFSLACKATNLKLFNLIPLPLSYPYLKAGLPVSPFFSKAMNRFAAWTLIHVPLLMKNIGIAARKFGVSKPRNFMDLWTGDVNIVADIKELSPIKSLPNNWYFSGPMFAHLASPIPDDIDRLLRTATKPKIFFAMGSSANRKYLLKVLAALEEIDAIVIAPIKSHLLSNDPVPFNVHVTDWVPALEVTKRVDVAVIHGGQGTVQTTVMAGVPFLGIGMQPEQEINIYLFEQFGNAMQMNKAKLRKKEIVLKINQLLKQPSFRVQAAKAQSILANVDVPRIIQEIVRSNT
jgi:UDP:flavonoid glycosyltransferase YjiC (YdhE family)